jgi:hypothetical protein
MLVNEIDELRVYRVIRSVQLRHAPNVSDESRIPKAPVFDIGELFAVDRARPSLVGSENGPFLQLSNAYGWLFERKHGDAFAVRMPLERGLWPYRVCNESVGLALRSHPTNKTEDEWKFGYSHGVNDAHVSHAQVLYPHDHVVWADARVSFEGVTYVRVQGTTGWLFTRRGERHVMTEILDPDEMEMGRRDGLGEVASSSANAREASFSAAPASAHVSDHTVANEGLVDLVDPKWQMAPEMLPLRDMRLMAKRHKLREVYFDGKEKAVVSFVKDVGNGDSARVDVYYATGTIAVTVRHHKHFARTRMFYTRCGIREAEKVFAQPNDPAGMAASGYKRRRTRERTPLDANAAARRMGVYMEGASTSTSATEDEEMLMRGELRGLDVAMDEMRTQRARLVEFLLQAELSKRRGGLARMYRENEARAATRRENDLNARGWRWRVVKAMRDTHPGLVHRVESSETAYLRAGGAKFIDAVDERERARNEIAHVAFNAEASFCAYADGCFFSGGRLPSTLVDFFGTNEPLSIGGTIPYLALSHDGRYYAVNSFGHEAWNAVGDAEYPILNGNEDVSYLDRNTRKYENFASDRFDALARRRDAREKLARVAFGVSGSWFAVFKNGRWEANGVPDRMVNFVHANGSSPVEVSLGADDTYFVRMRDGEVDFLLPRACAAACRALVDEGRMLKHVFLSPIDAAFGWIIRYE